MDVLLQSLKLGIAPSIVVAIYLLINKILEDKKEAKSAKLSAQVFDSFNKLNNFLDYFTKNIINKEIDKCDLGIRHSFDKLRCTLLDKTVVIVINNNVKLNEKIIKDNLTHLINGEYYVLLNNLKLYSTHFVNIYEYVCEDWKKELYDDIISIIFNTDLTKEQKIYALQNKLDNRINEYKSIILSSNLTRISNGTNK